MEKHDLLAIATCCREWPVYPFMGWGRCGYCQERPALTPDRTVADYMRDREAS
jgi:hypothetical protein